MSVVSEEALDELTELVDGDMETAVEAVAMTKVMWQAFKDLGLVEGDMNAHSLGQAFDGLVNSFTAACTVLASSGVKPEAVDVVRDAYTDNVNAADHIPQDQREALCVAVCLGYNRVKSALEHILKE